jgi:hypothetical protein
LNGFRLLRQPTSEAAEHETGFFYNKMLRRVNKEMAQNAAWAAFSDLACPIFRDAFFGAEHAFGR